MHACPASVLKANRGAGSPATAATCTAAPPHTAFGAAAPDHGLRNSQRPPASERSDTPLTVPAVSMEALTRKAPDARKPQKLAVSPSGQAGKKRRKPSCEHQYHPSSKGRSAGGSVWDTRWRAEACC